MNALTSDLTPQINKAGIGWPPALPIELALGVATPPELQQVYGIPDDEWEALPKNPHFVDALKRAVDRVREEGMGFKMRAQLLAEDNLAITQKIITDPLAPSSVRKDLIVAMARWAGYDAKQTVGADGNVVAAAGNNFQINIVLKE